MKHNFNGFCGICGKEVNPLYESVLRNLTEHCVTEHPLEYGMFKMWKSDVVAAIGFDLKHKENASEQK